MKGTRDPWIVRERVDPNTGAAIVQDEARAFCGDKKYESAKQFS